MSGLREPRQVGIEVLEDLNTGKTYRFDQRTGETSRCNARAEPVPRFEAYFSGVAPTKERVRRGMSVPILEQGIEKIPKYIGRPAKYLGFVSMRKPGLDMNARGKQCAFTIPEYLQPLPPTLGRVSTSSRKPPKPKIKKVSSLPTFLESLDSQFVETISMNAFTDNEPVTDMPYNKNNKHEYLADFRNMQSAANLEAITARNKQKYIEAMEKELEALKTKIEPVGKGRFGVTRPPFNPQEIKQIETERDQLIFPDKWRNINQKLVADKAFVRKRRRERYPEHFIKLDAREAAEAAQARRPSQMEVPPVESDATLLPSDIKAE